LNKNVLYLLIEPVVLGTYWYSMIMKGIYEQASKRLIGIKLIEGSLLKKENFQYVDTDGPVIVVAATINWFNEIYRILQESQIRSILICTGEQRLRRYTSIISLSHEESTIDIVNYMSKAGRRKTAYFACNPKSLVDKLKLSGYIKALNMLDQKYDEGDVYYNKGCIEECLNLFFKKINSYDGAICANDVSAIALMRHATKNGIKIPEDLYVAGFGDTIIGRIINPSLTSVTLNYFDVGIQAVENHIYIKKNPNILSQFTTIKSTIITRASTEFRCEFKEAENILLSVMSDHCIEMLQSNENSFYSDIYVADILKLENMFQNMDSIDDGILSGISQGHTYDTLTEELNISESTVKYRIKKLLNYSNMSSRRELVTIIDSLLGLDAVKSYLNLNINKDRNYKQSDNS